MIQLLVKLLESMGILRPVKPIEPIDVPPVMSSMEALQLEAQKMATILYTNTNNAISQAQLYQQAQQAQQATNALPAYGLAGVGQATGIAPITWSGHPNQYWVLGQPTVQTVTLFPPTPSAPLLTEDFTEEEIERAEKMMAEL